MDRETSDYLLASHIAYTSQGLGRRRPSRLEWPLALLASALVLCVAGLYL